MEKLNIGIVGAGVFANFAAKAFEKVEGIKVIAVTDLNQAAAQSLAKEVNAIVYNDYDTLLQDAAIDLVYIATPPSLHYQQSKAALLVGKHVICEKPAATKTSEAEELAAFAKANKLLYVVNLMQRYNPLYYLVTDIITEKVLGEFLHGFFENYASDEALHIDHWFWDETKSGGIFIEHGVHFFDMFSGWFGDGKLINAVEFKRPDIDRRIMDRVQATVQYGNASVDFYHGFNQPKLLDREELRLQFERGDITLYEWVPVKMRLHGLLKNSQLEKIKTVLGNDMTITYNDEIKDNRKSVGRFKDIEFDVFVTIESGDISNKMNRYEQLVTAMITDQWNWIKDNSHKRQIDEKNAVESLRIAEEAAKKALLV